jgi:signal peptidase II
VKDRRPLLLGITALVVLLDRLTKAWIVAHIPEGDTIPVIDHVFRLSHVRNPGAAFSLFTESTHPAFTHQLLTWFSVVAAAVILVILWRIGRRLTPTTLALAMILGGTIGNLWDRIRYGMVTDFLAVRIIHYSWPDFNVADSCIVIGGILLVLDSLRPQHQTPPQETNGR